MARYLSRREYYRVERDKTSVEGAGPVCEGLNDALVFAARAIDAAAAVGDGERQAQLRLVARYLEPLDASKLSHRGSARRLCASARFFAEACLSVSGASPHAHDLRTATLWSTHAPLSSSRREFTEALECIRAGRKPRWGIEDEPTVVTAVALRCTRALGQASQRLTFAASARTDGSAQSFSTASNADPAAST